MSYIIRNEYEADHRRVEELTRDAFWNLYVPGCDEHFLVHVIRNHPDFIPQLDLVIELDGEIVGSIIYAKSWLEDETGQRMEIISFGPVSVTPELQRKGIGSRLIQHSLTLAKEMGYKAVIIYGDPGNYCKHGFVSGKKLGISDAEGRFPYAMLALELQPGILLGKQWKYLSSNAYQIDPAEAEEFDKQFKLKKKEFRYTQELFMMSCSAYLD